MAFAKNSHERMGGEPVACILLLGHCQPRGDSLKVSVMETLCGTEFD